MRTTRRAGEGRRAALGLMWLSLVAGCAAPAAGGSGADWDGVDDGDPGPAASRFERPEGLAVAGNLLFVTNVASSWNEQSGQVEYGQGFVLVLEVGSWQERARIDLPAANPQSVVAVAGGVAVICSGTAAYGRAGVLLPQQDGALVRIGGRSLEVAGTTTVAAGVPTTLAGFPGQPAVAPDGQTLYAGSGTGSYLYSFPLAAEEEPTIIPVAPDDGRNDLTVPVFAGEELWVTSFLHGTIQRIDLAGGAPVGEAFPVAPSGQLEGPVAAVAAGERIYILMTLSARLVEFDPATGKAGVLCATGSAPNRVAVVGDSLVVVNSLDNNLSRYDLTTGKLTDRFAHFPPGTNPWELAVADDLLAVTGYLSDSLFLVSAESGKPVSELR